MTRIMLRGLAVAITLTVLSTASGFAITIDPQCASMNNKIGCTCALQSGGFVDGNHRWHPPHVRGTGATANPAFQQCIRDAGGGTE
jgi:hypothetical protein